MLQRKASLCFVLAIASALGVAIASDDVGKLGERMGLDKRNENDTSTLSQIMVETSEKLDKSLLSELIQNLMKERVDEVEKRHKQEINSLYEAWASERAAMQDSVHRFVQQELTMVEDRLHKTLNADMDQVDLWMRHWQKVALKDFQHEQQTALLAVEDRLRTQHKNDLGRLERSLLAQVDSQDAIVSALTGKVEKSVTSCLQGKGSQRLLENVEISGNDDMKSSFLRSSAFPSEQSGAALNAIEVQRVTESVNALNQRLDHLQLVLSCISPNSDSRDLYFDGCNVHIRNGLESTYTTSGTGNLVLGYNEETTQCAGLCERSGSHNLIIGAGHDFTSYGGLVLGERNVIAGEFSVAAGVINTASGFHSLVISGLQNIASGSYASVIGGRMGNATGDYSSILGGLGNRVTGHFGSVWAGNKNKALGKHAIIAGGQDNFAENDFTTVTGGYQHHTSFPFETVIDELISEEVK